MKTENYCIMEIPSKSCNEAFARAAVACFASQMDPTTEELEDIKTAVSEAVTNCIVHAYPNSTGMIAIRCKRVSDNELDIFVKDKGVGIEDLKKAMEPCFTTGGPERSGMGMTIMDSFMDSFTVRSMPGKGTVVHMRKKLASKL